MKLFLITVLTFGLVICIMAIGVIFGRRSLKGSCGGLGCGFCSPEEQEKCREKRNHPEIGVRGEGTDNSPD